MTVLSVIVQKHLTADTILMLPDDHGDEYEVDARHLEFAYPAGVVQLILALQSLARRGAPLRFIAPLALDVDSYLARMDLYEHMPAGVELVNAPKAANLNRADRRDVLIPLKSFHSSTDVEQLAEDLNRFLRGMDLPKPLFAVLWSTINELCDNSASHSGSPCGGFLAAQTYKGLYRHVAVGDIGIGIRRHLAYNPLYSSIPNDDAAIKEAIKPGVTGTAELRGWGFEEIQTEAGRLEQAELLIRSGTGWGRITIKGKRRSKQFGSTSAAFRGTLVQLILTPHL